MLSSLAPSTIFPASIDMAEEFLHGGICGGTWWNLPPSRSVFPGCSSPCTAVADFSWPMTDLQWNQSYPPSNNSTGQLDSPEVGVLKPMNQDNFSLDDQQPAPALAVTTTTTSTSCSASYSYPPPTTTASAAELIQTLFDDDPRPPPQPPVFSGRPNNFEGEGYDQLTSPAPFSWNKLPPFFRPASFLKQQQQLPVQFGNEAAFWNAASNNEGGDRFLASSPSEFLRTVFANKPTCPNNQLLPTKRNGEDAREGNNNNSNYKKGSGNESPPAVKRARIETPSPLPTFKVRKEKLGDRITALQQLVSPFGKTDTASVLQEAIEYIKFLHEQVSVLSTPYMKQGSSPNPHQQMMKDGDHNTNQELRSRGLCLVPISSTFPVATETTVDFWTPTFGATFR